MPRSLILLLAVLFAAGAQAAAVSELIGERVHNRGGEPVGEVRELIVDVLEGRVLYLIVEHADRYYSAPVRALDERLRLDMRLAGEMAKLEQPADTRFRRASKLLGQDVQHTGGARIGVIRDIEFEAQSGRIEHVVLRTDQGTRNFPADVLAHGRFPPLDAEPRSPGVEWGFAPAPSEQRRRLQDPRWGEN